MTKQVMTFEMLIMLNIFLFVIEYTQRLNFLKKRKNVKLDLKMIYHQHRHHHRIRMIERNMVLK